MTCANNCKGVNPNAVIIGGTAVLAASTVTLQQVIAIGTVAGGIGGVAVGQMMNRGCSGTRPCQVGCCLYVSKLSGPFLLHRDGVGGTPVAEFAADPSGQPTADPSVRGDCDVKKREGVYECASHQLETNDIRFLMLCLSIE